jgi:hypothetical protein
MAGAVVAPLLIMVFASSASALKTAEKEEFLQFSDCPLTEAVTCMISNTTSGEFVMGTSKKAVPLTKPDLLQGGVATSAFTQQPLLAAADGNTLAKVPQEIPGGLTGIGVGPSLTATAEIAGPVSGVLLSQAAIAAPSFAEEPAVILPLKVHLENELLGPNCYIGSDEEPILLKMNSVGPQENFTGGAKFKILKLAHVVLEDKTFSVPAAKGCGEGALEPVVTALVNTDVGLPSPAGENKALMAGNVATTSAENARKYLPKKKKEKKKK